MIRDNKSEPHIAFISLFRLLFFLVFIVHSLHVSLCIFVFWSHFISHTLSLSLCLSLLSNFVLFYLHLSFSFSSHFYISFFVSLVLMAKNALTHFCTVHSDCISEWSYTIARKGAKTSQEKLYEHILASAWTQRKRKKIPEEFFFKHDPVAFQKKLSITLFNSWMCRHGGSVDSKARNLLVL